MDAFRPGKRLESRLAPLPDEGTFLVLLGTRAGPHPELRAATVTALVVDGATYLIDAGAGLVQRFFEAGLDFGSLRAMFITHMHSDHVADFFTFFNVNFPKWRRNEQQIAVFGPGRADLAGPAGSAVAGMPEVPDTPVIAPDMPTPGIVEMTELLRRAYAYDLNNSIRTTRRPGGVPLDFMGATGGTPMIATNALPTPSGAHVANPSPPMEPMPVYQDDRVAVTATLVHHPPVFPAFGFRFDTPHGSVTISGDTTSCANLVRLARNTDVLVNEVVAVDEAVAIYAGTPLEASYRRQFLTAHTPLASHGTPDAAEYVAGVGAVASQAHANALVLTHVYPADGTVGTETFHDTAAAEFGGPVFVGDDLAVLDVGAVARPQEL